MIVLFISLLAIVLVGNKEFSFRQAKDYVSIAAIALFIFAYSYGSLIVLNCLYDRTEPKVYGAKIINKRVDSGKVTVYYLQLAPWGSRTESEEVTVSKELYNKLNKDSEAHIYFREGQFKIPWFVVGE